MRGGHLDESPFLGRRLVLCVLIALTLIAYVNAWPNSLTFDDRIFADSDRFTGIGLAEMARFFTEDLWSASGANSELYRPLLLVMIALESWVFGDWFAGYHLFNIFLHVLATVLVYGFVRRLLLGFGNSPSLSDSSALLAGVFFGVHPIHAEVVNSIFNGSEILVSIGVVGGLWWFLRTLPDHPIKAWFGLSIAYLFVLFCRESGAALPALAVTLLWLSSSDPWLRRMRKCLPVLVLLIPLGIYLTMRENAVGPQAAIEAASAVEPAEPVSELTGAGVAEQPEPASDIAETVVVEQPQPASEMAETVVAAQPQPPGEMAETAVAEQQEPPSEMAETAVAEQPAQAGQSGLSTEAAKPPTLKTALISAARLLLPQPDRLLPAVSLWFESWKIMLWPHPLQIFYNKPDAPGWIALTAQLALLGAGLLACIRKRPGLLAGMVFFYLAILPSSKMFGKVSLTPGLADRVLYLPSVGLTIIIAIGLIALIRRLKLRYAVTAVAVVTLVLMPLTWARNADWIDDVTLYESDYSKLDDKRLMLSTLVAAHLRENNLDRAIEICDTHADGLRKGWPVGIHCGTAYGRTGRYSDAEQAYLAVTNATDKRPKAFARLNLAMLYLHLGRRSDAEKQFELGIAAQNQSFLGEYFSALQLLQLYPNDRTKLIEARNHLEKALELQPQHFESREELKSLNARLAPSKRNEP